MGNYFYFIDSKSRLFCAFCIDRFDYKHKLSCGHVFCRKCISLWIDVSRTCPLCRTWIENNEISKINVHHLKKIDHRYRLRLI